MVVRLYLIVSQVCEDGGCAPLGLLQAVGCQSYELISMVLSSHNILESFLEWTSQLF
jgi:hypothetical protein